MLNIVCPICVVVVGKAPLVGKVVRGSIDSIQLVIDGKKDFFLVAGNRAGCEDVCTWREHNIKVFLLG